MALVAPGTGWAPATAGGSAGMSSTKASSQQQLLEGILPPLPVLGAQGQRPGHSSPECWSTVSLGQAVLPVFPLSLSCSVSLSCPLSLGCPVSLGSMGPGVAAGPGGAMGENNPEPQLGQFPQFHPGGPRSLPAWALWLPVTPVWFQLSPQYDPSHFQLHSV